MKNKTCLSYGYVPKEETSLKRNSPKLFGLSMIIMYALFLTHHKTQEDTGSNGTSDNSGHISSHCMHQ